MLTNDGQVYACGTFRDANGSIGLTEAGPHKEAHHLPCEKRIVKIASGGDHILALSEEGLVYSVGKLDCILAFSGEGLVYSVGELDSILALDHQKNLINICVATCRIEELSILS